MLCQNGHKNLDRAKFCAKCGAPIATPVPTAVPEPMTKEQSSVSGVSDDVASTEPTSTKTSRRGLMVAGAALLIALIVVGAVLASAHHNPGSKSSSTTIGTTSQHSPTTSGSQSSTSGTFPPSTTVPTTGLVEASLKLWTCPTSLGANEAPAKLTTPVQVMVPPGYTPSQLAVYSDNQGIMELLAPAGWDCQASVGADGSSGIEIYPPSQGAATGSSLAGGSTITEVSGYQTGGSPFSAASQACQLFPASNSALDGNTCPMLSPPAPKATLYTDHIIEFTDPPGVTGDAYPSGGAYNASGVMTYFTKPNAESWTETCVLAPSRSSLCTAILSSFITSYGRNG